MLLPTKTEFAATVLFTAKSARGMFVVTAIAELFCNAKSVATDTTLALFVKVPTLVALAVIVIVAVALLATVPRAPVIKPFVSVKPPCVVAADTNAKPVGNKSATTTPLAGDGPRLVTMIVNVTLLETNVEPPDAVLEMDKSATGLTAVTTEAESLAELKSITPDVTLAVFVMASSLRTVTTMVTVAVALLAKVPSAPTTTPFDSV